VILFVASFWAPIYCSPTHGKSCANLRSRLLFALFPLTFNRFELTVRIIRDHE